MESTDDIFERRITMGKLIKCAIGIAIGSAVVRAKTGYSPLEHLRNALLQSINNAEDRRLGRKYGYKKKIVVKVYQR